MQDVTSHPTWTGGKALTSDDGQIARFRRRFAGLQEEETEEDQGAQRDKDQ